MRLNVHSLVIIVVPVDASFGLWLLELFLASSSIHYIWTARLDGDLRKLISIVE